MDLYPRIPSAGTPPRNDSTTPHPPSPERRIAAHHVPRHHHCASPAGCHHLLEGGDVGPVVGRVSVLVDGQDVNPAGPRRTAAAMLQSGAWRIRWVSRWWWATPPRTAHAQQHRRKSMPSTMPLPHSPAPPNAIGCMTVAGCHRITVLPQPITHHTHVSWKASKWLNSCDTRFSPADVHVQSQAGVTNRAHGQPTQAACYGSNQAKDTPTLAEEPRRGYMPCGPQLNTRTRGPNLLRWFCSRIMLSHTVGTVPSSR